MSTHEAVEAEGILGRWFTVSRETVQRLVIFCILIGLCIVMAFLSEAFLNPTNLTNILRQVSMTAIVASAATMIMISGGLDISVGGLLAFSGVVTAWLCTHGVSFPVAVLGGILSGMMIGMINGFLVVVTRITPVIATLGTMYISRGVAFLISDGKAIVTGLPEEFKLPGRSYIGPIPTPVIITAIIFIFFYILLHRTILGKYTYAIGGNRETAILSGINVGLVHFILYILGGLATGIAGVIMASRLASGQPNIGYGFEFDVIVAVILGGTSLAGGEGTVFGTVVGALIVQVLRNGLNLMGVHTFWQYIFQGGTLVLAVILDMSLKGQGISLAGLKKLLSRR